MSSSDEFATHLDGAIACLDEAINQLRFAQQVNPRRIAEREAGLAAWEFLIGNCRRYLANVLNHHRKG